MHTKMMKNNVNTEIKLLYTESLVARAMGGYTTGEAIIIVELYN